MTTGTPPRTEATVETPIRATGQLATPTDKQATRIGGRFLKVPKDPSKVEVTQYIHKNGLKVTQHTWNELMVIDDITIKIEDDGDGSGDHESMMLKLRVTDKVPSPGENAGFVITDFGHWWWALGQFSDSQFETWARGDGARSGWQKKMTRAGMSSPRFAMFCKAMGYQDRLVNRSVFRGISRIKDVIGLMKGKNVTMKVQQSEDKEGVLRDNIRAYLSA